MYDSGISKGPSQYESREILEASQALLTTPREDSLAAVGTRSFYLEEPSGKSLFTGELSGRLNSSRRGRTGDIKLSLERGRSRTSRSRKKMVDSSNDSSVMQRLRQRQRLVGSTIGSEMGTNPIPNPTAMSRVAVPQNDGSYAIQTKGRTWQHVGRSRPFRETPITRKEVVALERRYDNAMRYSKMTSLAAASRDISPIFEQDVVSTRSRVLEMYMNDKNKCREQQRALTEAVVAQKWTDLVFGEVVSSVGNATNEQGRLMRKLRENFGHVFGLLWDTQSATLRYLLDAEEAQRNAEAEKDRLQAQVDSAEANFAIREEAAIAKVTAEKDNELSNLMEQLKESGAQNETLKVTLNTLNGIFKGLQKNNEMINAADLKDANTRLAHLLKESDAELHRFKGLEAEHIIAQRKIDAQEKQISELQIEVEKAKGVLAQRDELIQQLMQNASISLADKEVAIQKLQPDGTTSGAEGAAAAQEKLETMAKERTEADAAAEREMRGDDAEKDSKRGGGNDANVLCVRCKKSFAEARNLDDLEMSLGDKMKRLPCASFRVLLPNLMGYRPERTNGWVLRCIRSIMFSKMKEDAVASQRGGASLRPRMPEFVYSWFHPRVQYRNKRHRDEALAEADENRWALYYGVKKLSKRLPEAKLFFDLLDETHGEDDCTFYLYCLRGLRGCAAEDLAWPEYMTMSGNFTEMMQMLEDSGFDENDEDDEESEDNDSQVRWLSLEKAMVLIEHIMGKSTEAERDKIIMRIVNKSFPARGRLRGMEEIASDDEVDLSDDEESENKKVVDANVVIALLMQEYREEQAHRKASIRLMFDTALEQQEEERKKAAEEQGSGGEVAKSRSAPSLDLQQFGAMIKTLNANVPFDETVRLYRSCFERGRTMGVNIDDWMKEADASQFFSSCLRVPVHYGAAYSVTLTEDRIRELQHTVYRHFRLFDRVFDDFMHTLNPMQARELLLVRQNLLDELNRSNRSVVDGRRLLCAYRRVLHFMMARRMEQLEDVGEPGDKYSILRCDMELQRLEDILTRFVIQPGSEPVAKKLMRIMTRVNASRIQSVWRRRQFSHPVPLKLRLLMSKDYLRGKGALKGISRNRRVVRKTEWMIHHIHLILIDLYSTMQQSMHREFLADQRRVQRQAAIKEGKTEADMNDEALHTEGSVMDRTSERQAFFLQLLYNQAVQRYGTVALAERTLHDLFSTCRAHCPPSFFTSASGKISVPSSSEDGGEKKSELNETQETTVRVNGLAQVFYAITTAGKYIKMPEFGDTPALEFLLRAIAIARTRDSPESKKFFFPQIDPESSRWFIHRDVAAEACKKLFPDKEVYPGLISKVKQMSNEMIKIKKMHVDIHDWLWLIMERWVVEIRKRQRTLRSFLVTLEPNNGLAKVMASVPAFASALRPCSVFVENGKLGVTLRGDTGEEEEKAALVKATSSGTPKLSERVVRCYVQAVREWHLHGNRTRAIMNSCRLQGLTAWNDYAAPERNQLLDKFGVEAKCLEAVWNLFKTSIENVCNDLQGKKLSEDTYRELITRSKDITEKAEALLKATAPGAPELRPGDLAHEVLTAWSDLREQFSEVDSIMEVAKMKFLKDQFSDNDTANANLVKEEETEEKQ
eukprot:g3070.t1